MGGIFMAVGVAGLAGCAEVRLLTYPEEFVYLDRGDVSSIMHRMARSMVRLDELVQSGEVGAPARRAVMAELDVLESEAQRLNYNTAFSAEERDAGSLPATNHLLFDDYVGDFLEQLDRARLLASQEPPSYYGVGRLTGECVACHRMR